MARRRTFNLAVAAIATCTSLMIGAPAASASAQGPAEQGQIIRDVFIRWGGLSSGEADKAVQIASCESGLNPQAVGAFGTAIGLFQILPGMWRDYGDSGDPYNSYDNSKAAVRIYLAYQRSWTRVWPGCA
ncbi:transglycosylase SLT domain-containing protein [Streptomyces goshikiensis]|uniref:transglycosylase SLT domain-containing protein n=1 Tax=Streptomyces goshikiensis TaxID=1942 RepID=UPI00366043D5